MRKFMVSCMGIFLMTWGLSTDVFASDLNHSKRFKIGNILLANASPQNYEDSVDEEIKIGMLVDKVATPSGEFYDVQFYAEGEPLENVKTIRIKTPESKNILLKNPVGLSYLEVEAYNMGIDDLKKRFPEGKYQVSLSSRKYRKATTFDMEYDFPAAPVVTSPTSGATDVSLSPTFEWESMADDDIDGLLLILLTEDFSENYIELIRYLPKETTSFSISEGLLEANTEYELDVVAYKAFGENAYMTGVRYISFTTSSATLPE